jgi:hypothetical protein
MKSSMSRVLLIGGLAAAALTIAAAGAALSQAPPPAQPARVAVPVPPSAANYSGGAFAYTPGQNVYSYGFQAVSSEQAQAAAALEQKSRELLAKYTATEDSDEKAKVVEQLTAAVGEQFDARQGIRQQELKRLEEQLKKLRALHDRRATEKSQIIEDRVKQLLRDADGLGWGNEENRGYFSVQPAHGAAQVYTPNVAR